MRPDTQSITRRPPTKGIFERTTSKIEQENVKSKILGHDGKGTGSSLRPSYKVREILIGKSEETSKEDSLIDEYKNSENAQGNENIFKEKSIKKDEIKETGLHDLVTASHHTIGPVFSDSKTSVEHGDATSDVSRTDESQAPSLAGGEVKGRDMEESPSKSRVSQYSKIKAEEGKSTANDALKDKQDPGESFLKKQQQLMHRAAEVRKEPVEKKDGVDRNINKVFGSKKVDDMKDRRGGFIIKNIKTEADQGELNKIGEAKKENVKETKEIVSKNAKVDGEHKQLQAPKRGKATKIDSGNEAKQVGRFFN